MLPTTYEYDTELRRDGAVLELDGVLYQGRTVLAPGADTFAPLRVWARHLARYLDAPVTWRAAYDGATVQEGTECPG